MNWKWLAALGATSLGAATPHKPGPDANAFPSQADLQRRAARFAPTEIGADLSHLPGSERAALAKLIQAAKRIDALFLRQMWSGNESVLMDLSRDTSALGRERLHYFLINKGPWSALDGNVPFIPGVPPKPRPANFYPPGASEEAVEKWIQSLDEPQRKMASGFFTVLRWSPDGSGKFQVVPYSQEYQPELAEVASLLKEAAVLTTDQTLRAFLIKRAAAFALNDYYDSDLAWMELTSAVEPTIGPYEVYQDEWFNAKAAFEAFIAVRDEAETAKLARFGGELQEIENHLPIDSQLRNPKLGATAPIRVVNLIFSSGDGNHGVQTAAYNLPNDERITKEKGAKRVMLKNVQEAKFKVVLLPIAKVALSPADHNRVSFDAFFTHILMHELMHGLGPHVITVGGRASTVRQELRDSYSAIEEAKADISGLFALQYLIDKGVLAKSMESSIYTTFLASCFRSLRFGLTEAHAKGIALQLNYLLDAGGFGTSPDGTFFVNASKIKAGVAGLTRELMTLQAQGNRAKAMQMLSSLSVVRASVKRVLDRLSDVPVDIEPQFRLRTRCSRGKVAHRQRASAARRRCPRWARWRPFILVAVSACDSHRAIETFLQRDFTRQPTPAVAKLEGPPLWPAIVDLPDAARKAKILELAPQLDKQIADYREKQKLPGLAVGIVVLDELSYAKGFGVRDLETNAPADADTVFRIASLTKSFTALAVLKLRDEGKLSLEDPVNKYVPELARQKAFTRDSAPITIREILSHSAGFPEDNAWADPRLDLTDQEFSEMLRHGLAFSTSSGTGFEYSNLGFAIAGQIVQRVSGMRYQEFVTRQILRPLGMTATVWEQKNVPPERLAKGYEGHSSNWAVVSHRGPPQPIERSQPQVGDGAFASIGGLYTSIRDYARYVSLHLQAWPPRDGPDQGPVHRSSIRESHQMARYSQLAVSRAGLGQPLRASAKGYGLGWGVSEHCDFDRVITHGGGLPGFGSYVVLLPDQGVGIFAFANATYAETSPLLFELARTLSAKGAMHKRRVPVSAALSLAQMVLLPLLENWDDARADRIFDKTFFQYNPPERLDADLPTLHQRHGSCSAVGQMAVENALRGKIQLECDRGQLEVEIGLTPDEPIRVQWMRIAERLPPSEAMVKIAGRAARAIGASSRQGIDELLAAEVDRDRLHSEIDSVPAGATACELRRWWDGDGQNAADFELACGKESLELRLRINASQKIEQLAIRRLQDPSAKCPL